MPRYTTSGNSTGRPHSVIVEGPCERNKYSVTVIDRQEHELSRYPCEGRGKALTLASKISSDRRIPLKDESMPEHRRAA